MRLKNISLGVLAVASMAILSPAAHAQYYPWFEPMFKSNTQFRSTPVWQQSAAGGYYDATGQVGHIVHGSELWRFGGTFGDGRPVPNGPAATNFAGHVYY